MEEKTFFKGEWKAVEKLGEGSFGIVYKAVKEQYGVESYSAIKQIMIPQTDEYFSKLKSQGMTQSDIEKSYDSQVKKWVEEIQFLNQFKDNENIVSIEDFEVLKRNDKPGRTINIRMELLQNIDDHVMDRTITDKKVLKMASDILKALEECEEKNVVHRDIKPENVFVNSRGTYKLGDFGEAKSIEKTVSNMSKKGTENYMAPEIYKGERGSRSVDTYSLGIMLYKYFNNNRLPFIPDYPNQITFEDMEKALEKRMNGEEMKPPVKASNNIARIILKACRYKPADRYKSAMEFRNDIEEELRAIINPIKLFDFQEGEIEKDNSISEFGKTVGIFEDDTNSKTSLDRTTGIFDDYSKNEEQNNKHIKKSREIIEKACEEDIRVNNANVIKNSNLEEIYEKKQFEYQANKESKDVDIFVPEIQSKIENKIETKGNNNKYESNNILASDSIKINNNKQNENKTNTIKRSKKKLYFKYILIGIVIIFVIGYIIDFFETKYNPSLANLNGTLYEGRLKYELSNGFKIDSRSVKYGDFVKIDGSNEYFVTCRFFSTDESIEEYVENYYQNKNLKIETETINNNIWSKTKIEDKNKKTSYIYLLKKDKIIYVVTFLTYQRGNKELDLTYFDSIKDSLEFADNNEMRHIRLKYNIPEEVQDFSSTSFIYDKNNITYIVNIDDCDIKENSSLKNYVEKYLGSDKKNEISKIEEENINGETWETIKYTDNIIKYWFYGIEKDNILYIIRISTPDLGYGSIDDLKLFKDSLRY